MPKESKQPYVRFFTSDWLAGTRGMKAFETGIYITLIAMMYERCEPISEDHNRLARQCGASVPHFKSALEMLVEDGKITRTEKGLYNRRVAEEVDWRLEKSNQNKKSANARYQKANKNKGHDLRTQCERSANAVPYQKPEPERKKESAKGAQPAASKGVNIKDRIFGGLSDWLIEKTGKDKQRVNAILGKWIKEFGEPELIEAALKAHRENPVEPVSWIAATLRKRQGGGTRSKHPSPPRQLVDDARAFLLGIPNRNGELVTIQAYREIENEFAEWIAEFKSSLQQAKAAADG